MTRGRLLACGLLLMCSGGLTARTLNLTTFDPPPSSGVGSTRAWDINNAGQIVGQHTDPGPIDERGFVPERGFLKDGNTFTTIDYPGSLFTVALGINDHGQVVGSIFWSDLSSQGFVWENGVFVRLIDGPWPEDISDDGDLIYNVLFKHTNHLGQTAFRCPPLVTGLEPQHICVTTPSTGHTEQFDLAWVGAAALAQNVQILGVNSINDRGEIVGYYRDGTGEHGFLAQPTVPEPNSLGLYFAGLVAVCCCRLSRVWSALKDSRT
jgi:uncharacterized membrane protein